MNISLHAWNLSNKLYNWLSTPFNDNEKKRWHIFYYSPYIKGTNYNKTF